MPPLPMSPMKRPWPAKRCHGLPSEEIARPTHTMAAPNITVQRTPTRSAMRPITMPPTPTPIQPREPANAGVSRPLPKSAAMALSETTATHGAPNESASASSAAVAATQDVRVSMVVIGTDECMDTVPAGSGERKSSAGRPRRELYGGRPRGQMRGAKACRDAWRQLQRAPLARKGLFGRAKRPTTLTSPSSGRLRGGGSSRKSGAIARSGSWQTCCKQAPLWRDKGQGHGPGVSRASLVERFDQTDHMPEVVIPGATAGGEPGIHSAHLGNAAPVNSEPVHDLNTDLQFGWDFHWPAGRCDAYQGRDPHPQRADRGDGRSRPGAW